MIYLASPYSDPDPFMVKTRFLLAQQCTAELLKQGIFVYSPIVHCHELAWAYNLPGDFAFWKAYNFDMLRRADMITVLKITGWDKSVGVSQELEAAKYIGLPVSYCDEFGAMLPCE